MIKITEGERGMFCVTISKKYLIRSEGFFLGKNDILTESQKSEILVEMFIVSSSEKLWALERI